MRIELRRERGVRAEGAPLYLQIAKQIQEQVGSGQLAPGARLPTIRELARELRVNRDTVSQAYDHLAQAGVVESTVGRGTFVRALPGNVPGVPRAVAPPPLAPLVDRLVAFDRARPRYGAIDGAVPLHSLIPDPSLYPVDDFRRALDRALKDGGPELLAYGDPQGHAALREVMAKHLASHGMSTDAQHVVLCQGASQGIAMALRLYAQPGDTVAVEEPTYHNLLGVLVGLGLQPAPIPMTDDGPDLEILERTLARQDVRLFYTMPSFHNPMGTTTSLAHRQGLLEVAARCGKPVIEDSFEMDLRYDGEPVPPLAALDENGLVIHLFSFSKSLFPGVRIGAISAQGRAISGLLALKKTMDLSGSRALQSALADFVSAGAYERHLTRLRKTLRERRDALMHALTEEMPSGVRWTRPDGGYQVWLELPEGLDTGALLPDAQRAGVVFAPGYQFHHDGRPSRGMRLTIALADSDEVRRGIAILGNAVRRRLSAGVSRPRESSVHV